MNKCDNENVKQVILVRKDLKMPVGKACAQASHASLGALLKMFTQSLSDNRTEYKVTFEENSILDKWLNGIFTKVCLRVDSEEEIVGIYKKISEYNESSDNPIPIALIEDNGLTCFNGVKTITCLGIGPAYCSDIDNFTKHLKLLY